VAAPGVVRTWPTRASDRSGRPLTGEGGGAHGLLLAGVTAIPTVTGGLDSGIRCPTLGERRSSGLVGHVILLSIRAEGNGLG